MKISNAQLRLWTEESLSVTEMAKRANVTKGAVSKRLKRLNLAVCDSAMTKHADRVMDMRLDTLGQLKKVNENCNEILDLLMRWNRGDQEALQILESQVRKVKVKGKEEDISEYRFKDPRELIIRVAAEIRAQIETQANLYKMLFDQKAALQFQEIVLNIINEIAPELRDKILFKLRETGAAYSLFDFSKRGN